MQFEVAAGARCPQRCSDDIHLLDRIGDLVDQVIGRELIAQHRRKKQVLLPSRADQIVRHAALSIGSRLFSHTIEPTDLYDFALQFPRIRAFVVSFGHG